MKGPECNRYPCGNLTAKVVGATISAKSANGIGQQRAGMHPTRFRWQSPPLERRAHAGAQRWRSSVPACCCSPGAWRQHISALPGLGVRPRPVSAMLAKVRPPFPVCGVSACTRLRWQRRRCSVLPAGDSSAAIVILQPLRRTALQSFALYVRPPPVA